MKIMATYHKGRYYTLHRDDCPHLLGRKTKNAIDVTGENIDLYRTCNRCFAEIPRAEVKKRYCVICRTKNPCGHNGGQKVKRTVRRGDQTYEGTFWVWPNSPVTR